MAQTLPTPDSNPDWGQIGTLLSVVAAMATGAWTWWKTNGPGKPNPDAPPKVEKADPDMYTIEGLRMIVSTLQQENARLVAENERLWARQNRLEDFILKLQQRMHQVDGKPSGETRHEGT